EITAVLARILKPTKGDSLYIDVPKSYWAAGDIAAMKKAAWIKGYPDGTFRPQAPITRGELAFILADCFDIKQKGDGFYFSDLGLPGEAFADEAIKALAEKEIASGLPDSTFAPQKPITRGEAAALINKTINYQKSLDDKTASMTYK
ncbi:MAG: S-layer homology domain-containing protein, partial [Clostridiales bacterium]